MHSILEKGYDLSSSLPVSFQKKKKMPLFLSEVATALKNNKNPALAYLWILMNIYSLCYSGLSPPPPQLGVSVLSMICGIILAIFFLFGFVYVCSLKHKQNGAIHYNYFLILFQHRHKGIKTLSSREEMIQSCDKLGLGESLGGQQCKVSTLINRDNCTHSLVMYSIPF